MNKVAYSPPSPAPPIGGGNDFARGEAFQKYKRGKENKTRKKEGKQRRKENRERKEEGKLRGKKKKMKRKR